MTKWSLVIVLLLLFLAGLAACAQAEVGLLGQDLSVLENTDGKIVKIEDYDFDKYIAEQLYLFEQDFFKRNAEIGKKSFRYYRMEYLSDGLKVVGFIVKPKEEGKYPVVIYNRGGHKELGKIDVKELLGLSFFAKQGYVVIASQYRGNDGSEGKDEFGGSDVNDVLNLIPLAKSLPFTDGDRIVMFGGSRGGLMTYLAIKAGADIKAAVVVSGVTDVIQAYNGNYWGMKEDLEDMIGGSPEEMEEEYKKRSAYYWPEAINIPVLIMHGKHDPRVRVSQAEKLAARLEELNKTYKLIIYDADHDLGFLSTSEEWQKETFAWFEQYLK